MVVSRSPSQRRFLVVAGLALVAAAGAAVLWTGHRLPKRFGVVEDGRLYRCGEITPSELEHVTRNYGLRTILSLLNPDVPESVAERRAAEELGLRWVNVPLPGNGASTAEQREKIKAVLFDLDAAPILVHCAAGANRTGLAVGMYRLHRSGWEVEQVLAEMRDHGFEDLPRHENLRAALAAEWRAARSGDQPSTQPVGP
jgi:tyrosine-protein phosphatase SIW14